MKSLSLAGAIALSLFAVACNDSQAGAGKSTPSHAIESAVNKLENIDFSKLAPQELADKAKASVNQILDEIAQAKDSAAAKELVAKFEPVVDRLAAAKDKLLEQKVDMSAIKTRVDELTTKLTSDVMAVVQPLIDKIKALCQ
jgi:hypothetical protein